MVKNERGAMCGGWFVVSFCILSIAKDFYGRFLRIFLSVRNVLAGYTFGLQFGELSKRIPFLKNSTRSKNHGRLCS